MDLTQLEQALNDALGTVLRPDDWSITVGPDDFIGIDAGDLDCSTDNWSLRFESWPDGRAWIAVDDEPDPDSPQSLFRQIRRDVMPRKVEHALADADLALGGALTAALAKATDPMSRDLLAALTLPDV